MVRPVSNLRITELREAAGLSKAELARRAGINERTVRNLENGRYGGPSMATARKLAVALGVSFDSLFQDART